MPETVSNESGGRSSGAVISWWNQLHFSGRVIMSSVLFGFGLVLVGGLLLAINTNSDSTKTNDESYPNEITTKAPSNIVGPVVMGVGSFIVIIGIMMCLVETQVCRKKNGELGSLISEDKNETEFATESSVSECHRQENRKSGVLPKRCKGHHGKSHQKGKKQQKTASLQSDPLAIKSPRQFLTSSEETFLTPTNTLTSDKNLLFDSPNEAENQTSKSSVFTSSGPWPKSSEFQTPCTSFKDTSMSLDSSTEMSDKRYSLNASELQTNVNFNSKFLTPLTPDDEKLQKSVSHMQKAELVDAGEVFDEI